MNRLVEDRSGAGMGARQFLLHRANTKVTSDTAAAGRMHRLAELGRDPHGQRLARPCAHTVHRGRRLRKDRCDQNRLLAWAPVIGDPLTLVAGILRENFWVFVTLVTIRKLRRYIIVVMAV
jgi:hypothetical protein